MKDSDRLLDSSDSEVARLLLRAGHEDAPHAAKRRALAAATGVLAASTLTAGNATGAAVASKAAVGAKAATLVSFKWIVVAGVASVSVAAGTVAVQAVRAERESAAAAPPTSPVPARSHVSASAPAPRAPVSPPVIATADPATAAPSVDPPAPATPLPPPARTIRSPVKSGSSKGSTSSAELAMLDQARGAMDSGDPARALSTLDAYRGRFPHGAMGPEASMLRIEALVASGDHAAARRAADAFLLANPTSPYASRIQTLLAPSNP